MLPYNPLIINELISDKKIYVLFLGSLDLNILSLCIIKKQRVYETI